MIGAGLGALAGLALASQICSGAEDYAYHRYCAGDGLETIGGFTLAGAATGALVGALVGAAFRSSRPAGYQPRLWERASGEIGELALHAGMSSLLGSRRAEALAPALRVSLLVRLGDHFALGPEVGYYPGRVEVDYGANTGVVVERRKPLTAGLALRVGLPSGPLFPYLGLGLSLIDRLYDGLGGSAALGVTWRLRPQMSLGAEARVHSGFSAIGRDALVNITGGVAWHW